MLYPDPDGPETLERSIDFSKLPNLQEVNLVFKLAGGGPPRIPVAFSTLRPATTPRLSTVRLEFAYEPTLAHLIEIVVEEVISYIELVPCEIARIEHEFEGAVDFTVAVDSEFEAVLGDIDVRFRFDKTLWSRKFIPPILADPSAPSLLRGDLLPSF